MGFFSFLIKDKKTEIVNSIFLFLFTLFFIYIIYGFFQLDLLKGKVYSVVIGGWKKSMGIELKYDIKSALAILSAIIVLMILFINNLKSGMSYAFRGFACIMLCGVNGIITTNDIFNAYVFFEIICITTYIIYSHGENKTCLKNAYNYMILSGFAGVVFLFVASLLYQITGNLNLDIINKSIEPYYNAKSISAIFVLFILAMMFKLGIYPLHNVIFDIYKNLSIRYLIVVAGLSSIAYPFFILKFTTNLFGEKVVLNNEYLSFLLKIFGGIGFVFFNSMALSASGILKFIIALSFAQTSLFAFCLTYAINKTVLNGLIFGITSHTIIKVCLFALLYQLQKQVGELNIKKSLISCISSRTYKLLFVILLFLISGMPFSLVFMSKWYILVGIFNSNTNVFWLAVIVIGFAIDIFACFMFIKQILIQNDNKVLEIKENYLLIFYIIAIVSFLVLFSMFVGKF